MPPNDIFPFVPPGPATSGGAGSDDEMWVVPCNLEQVRSLIQDPERWMKALSDASQKSIELLSPFTMKVRLLPPDGSVPEGVQFLVQGINGTSLITIRPVSMEHISQFVNPWRGYWQNWMTEPQVPAQQGEPAGVPMFVVKTHGVGYSHMELSEDNDPEDVRADKVAAFLVWSATGFTGDGDSPIINKILTKQPRAPQVSVHQQFEPVELPVAAFKEMSREELREVDFLYIGVFGGAACRACDNKAGYMNAEGKIVVDEVTVKCYKNT